jgi:beta-phosphoglucomutase-like phosphatase (HAD superfamily)
MYPRVNYEMTEEDLKELLDACRPTPVMKIGSYTGSSPQENANRAWRKLGEKYGFDFMTVRPIQGKGQRFFSAVPTETKEQREERERKEKEEKRQGEILTIEQQITGLQKRLEELKKQD